MSKKNDDHNNSNKKKLKTSNIGLKVPDIEWQTSGRNVRPPASNKNPA